MRLLYLNGPTLYRLPVEEGQLDAMERQLRALWTAIERAIAAGEFPPAPGSPLLVVLLPGRLPGLEHGGTCRDPPGRLERSSPAVRSCHTQADTLSLWHHHDPTPTPLRVGPTDPTTRRRFETELERLLADAGIGYSVVFDGESTNMPVGPIRAMADRSVAACCAA